MTPVAIIDIGSNSVRLVVYEGLSRSPTPLFNEKILCGLGRSIGTTRRLDEEAVERALAALRRFKKLAIQSGAEDIHTVATAAAREAKNGPAFIKQATKILSSKIHVLTGSEEAYFAALGIVCGFDKPKGVSADMGGGSVEFTYVDGSPKGEGYTFPLGGLRLQEDSKGSVGVARKLARDALARNPLLKDAKGGNFYAVGGTWRALGRLHMARNKYPLDVMHQYEISASEAKRLCTRLMRDDWRSARGMDAVSSNRRPLMPFGAALLIEILTLMKPSRIIFSGLGVREGYLYSLLPEKIQKADPLLTAAVEWSVLRSRSPEHARELVSWTGQAFKLLQIDEDRDEKRYRKAACYLADIAWRSHPDYRGAQSLNLISNGDLMGVDHIGRAYLSLASYYRHEGLMDDDLSPAIINVAPPRIRERARILGGLYRIAYLISAAMPGVLPKIQFKRSAMGAIDLVVPPELAEFEGERLKRRRAGLSAIVGCDINWVVR